MLSCLSLCRYLSFLLQGVDNKADTSSVVVQSTHCGQCACADLEIEKKNITSRLQTSGIAPQTLVRGPTSFAVPFGYTSFDNDVALACLVSGCSNSSSLSAVVDYTWAQIPVLGCWPWFERVPSKCNIVDGLSRKNFSTALVNDWVRDSAQLPEPLLNMTHARS